MKRMIFPAGSALLGIGLLLLCLPTGQAADEQADEAQVQQEGPIHEAYAAPRSVSPQQPQQVQQQPPPDVKEEMPDEMPDEDNAQWIPGYWDANGQNDFTWVSGCWRVPPPNQQWVPGYWQGSGSSYRRQPGFWTQCNAGEDGETAEQDVSYYPQPPEPQDEDPGEDPDGESDWSPGSWVYSPTDPSGFVWRPGLWIHRRPGWLWSGSTWWWTRSGYIWRRGFWDYSYARRGWPYAPVRIPRGLRNRPGFVYRPKQVISPTSLNKNSLTINRNGFRLKRGGAKIVPINRLTGVKRVPVTPAKRTRLQNQTKKLTTSAILRKKLEGSKKHPGKGVVHHKLNVPRPRPTKNPSRLTAPPRPTRPVAKKPSSSIRKPSSGGVRRPPSRTTVKKPGGTSGVRKPPSRTSVAKKPPVRKTTGPKRTTAARKPPVRKSSTARRPAARPPAKKAGGARKTTARRPAPRRPAPRRTAARRPTPHRSAPRRAGGARPSGGGARRSGGGGRRR